ncbi:hypothetical protein B0T20DRAFT_217668 [Sordaria brevicollis]|uniref:Uncharacterized protein n=1 Tax=Sordaria brevicollis TaxID=83679 RepID=A0AAE0PFU9_SORBR|nr:hypothetical protein B0T20DRAFT_217668 [Sordaria brevicollis]
MESRWRLMVKFTSFRHSLFALSIDTPRQCWCCQAQPNLPNQPEHHHETMDGDGDREAMHAMQRTLPIVHFVLARLSNRWKQTVRPLPPSCLMVLESGSPRPCCRAIVFVCSLSRYATTTESGGQYRLLLTALEISPSLPLSTRPLTLRRAPGVVPRLSRPHETVATYFHPSGYTTLIAW